MDFASAINSLSDGKAVKPTSWGGFVKRVDSAMSEFSTTSTYTVGRQVMYGGSPYECTTAVTTAGSWNSSKWTRLPDRTHTLTFVERSPTANPDGDGHAEYSMTVTVSTSGTSYGAFNYDLKIDPVLFKALLDNTWTLGDTASYNAARTGSARW